MRRYPLEEFACEFKNEAECEEELNEAGMSMSELDRDFDDE